MIQMSTITSKGQTTIPEHIRTALSIQKGDKVLFKPLSPASRDTKEIIMHVISQQSVVDQLAGSLISTKKYADIDTIRKIAGKKYGKQYAIK